MGHRVEPWVRQRAERRDLVTRRMERRAAAPLANRLPDWNMAVARFAARADFLKWRQSRAKGSLQEEVRGLQAIVLDEVDHWEAELGDLPRTGAIADADKAVQVILKRLAQITAALDRSGTEDRPSKD